MEIGAEKLRYLTGVAIAVNHKGRVVNLRSATFIAKLRAHSELRRVRSLRLPIDSAGSSRTF